jgi:hypothetical protein
MDTPKHLSAMAASNSTRKEGSVMADSAEKDDVRPMRAADLASRCNPKMAAHAEKRMVKAPGMIPPAEMAEGMASILRTLGFSQVRTCHANG